jgi:prepilin-type N-terminal cleavage/methylation domain-containing protein
MTTTIARSRRGRAHGLRSGFSLIEILVVLVILLIGILTILRLFPGGFLTIRRTGEITAAEALANQMLASMKEAQGLPDSIIAVVPDGAGGYIPDLTARPDDLSDNNPNAPDWYLSNVNRFRRVLGETFRIPVPTANNVTGGFGATYVLQFGPVFNRFTGGTSDPEDAIDVRGAAMERVEANSERTFEQPENIPNLREGQYAIDYARRRIAFYPRVFDSARAVGFRTFSLRYEYQALVSGNIVVRSALTGSIRVPDVPLVNQYQRPAPIWQPIFNDANDPINGTHPLRNLGTPAPANIYYGTAANPTNTILPQSEDISRAFRLLTPTPVATSGATPQWSDDPYEYVWYSQQIVDASSRNVNANIGTLLFNPRGYSATIGTPSGPQPFTARVDYLIFDNHIIRDEKQTPSSAPYTVRLSLNDQTEYNGMFRGYQLPTDVGLTPEVLVINANTGQTLAQIVANSCTQYGGSDIFTLDAKNGVLRFNQQFIEDNNLRNATFKIFYRTANDWGMQVLKSHNRYIPSDVPSTTDPGNGGRPLDYRSYYVGGTQAGVGLPTRIYFPITESGKTVVLGDYYAQTANGVEHHTNETYKINEDPAQYENLNNIPLTWIDVQRNHPNITALTAARTGRAVNNVHGGSVKARVVWRNSSNRWRRVDSETFISK